jgi:hypothetical protein
MNTKQPNRGGRPEKSADERRISYTRRYLPHHLAKIRSATGEEFDALLEAWAPKTKKKPA